jgi:L-lactate dehydrogenase complex protein LldG
MLLYKSKENILKKIRAALVETTPVPFIQSEGHNNLFEAPHDDLAILFAEAFTKLDGKFVYIESYAELAEVFNMLVEKINLRSFYCAEKNLIETFETNNVSLQYTNDLAYCDASITSCVRLVARTGSIVLGSSLPHGRTASVYAPVHVCIAYTSQLVYDAKDYLQTIKDKTTVDLPSFITFATGPSRTADIEKTLVKGIHGPKEVICILIEDKA